MVLQKINYLIRYKKIFLKLLKHPILLKEVYIYLKNDLLALFGYYHYDYHIIFIAGLPKSGTTWLRNMLARIPGYNVRPFHDPKGVTLDHDVCDSVFLSLPKNRYTVLKLHTKYSEENFKVIKKHVPKFIVTYRDLRDMCISRYFHIKADPKHRHHEFYNKASLEDGIMHCIRIIEDEYVSWVKDWIDISHKYKDMILTIKYEDLNRDPFHTLKKIMEFYNFDFNDDFVSSLASSKLKKEKNLAVELKKGFLGRLGSTARKGIIGDWKNYFNDNHKKKFKEIAGDLLIELGYEKDYNW